MAQNEKKLIERLQVDWTQGKKGRLFRNNVAKAWVGDTRWVQSSLLLKALKMLGIPVWSFRHAKALIMGSPRRLHAGLCLGSSDLIGWTTVEITPEMVGQKVAIFTAIEVKTGNLKATKEQKNFIDIVNASGGIGKVERDVH